MRSRRAADNPTKRQNAADLHPPTKVGWFGKGWIGVGSKGSRKKAARTAAGCESPGHCVAH